MATFKLDFDPLPGDGIADEALGATFARLRILVDGQCVTRVFDKRSRVTREDIYVPLFPLAEWLAENWWFLSAECEGDTPRPDFQRRHDLRFARDGYALPSLRLIPRGEGAKLEWRRWTIGAAQIEFMESGDATVPLAAIEDELAAFIEAVIGRLPRHEAAQTGLVAEWDTIRRSQADPEERSFCRAAAALGLDPYDVGADDARALESYAERLPDQALRDLCGVSSPADFSVNAGWVTENLAAIDSWQHRMEDLRDLRRTLDHQPIVGSPWSHGYDAAGKLRAKLELNGRRLRSIEEVVALFDGAGDRSCVVTVDSPADGLKAVIGVGEDEAPGFVLAWSPLDMTRRFAFCRAVYGYLAPALLDRASIVADVRTERQQASRAFAAEFLAPSHLIRDAVSRPVLDSDSIDELAEDFAVSSWVIRHQVRNHQIAEISEE